MMIVNKTIRDLIPKIIMSILIGEVSSNLVRGSGATWPIPRDREGCGETPRIPIVPNSRAIPQGLD